MELLQLEENIIKAVDWQIRKFGFSEAWNEEITEIFWHHSTGRKEVLKPSYLLLLKFREGKNEI